MDDKNKQSKQPIIIIKRGKAAHGGAHGGAWKVAYADFVTAMMAFFMVMWLMGADEEVKSAIQEYFQNPTSSKFKRDAPKDDNNSIGGNTGDGESVLNGLNGANPDDMVPVPSIPFATKIQPVPDVDVSLKQFYTLAEDPNMKISNLKFSIPEKLLFAEGQDDFTEEGQKALNQVGKVLKAHRGVLKIEGYSYPPPDKIGAGQDAFEFSTTRVVSVMAYLVYSKFIDEARVKPVVHAKEKTPPPDTSGRVTMGKEGGERYLVFTLTPAN